MSIMKTRKPKRRSPEQVAQVAAGLRQRLAEWEEDADPALIAAVLATHAGYSGKNPLRIALQDPEATDVRGYREWQSIGRQVGKYPEGQGGITILAVHERKSENGDGPSVPLGDADRVPGAKPAPDGSQVIEGSSSGRRRSSASMVTVHDVRWTFSVYCAAESCGLPIHLVSVEKQTKKLQWTHTGRRGIRHEARPPKPAGKVMVPQPPAGPVPGRGADLGADGLADEVAGALGTDDGA